VRVEVGYGLVIVRQTAAARGRTQSRHHFVEQVGTIAGAGNSAASGRSQSYV
jgi:hypothetical protein